MVLWGLDNVWFIVAVDTLCGGASVVGALRDSGGSEKDKNRSDCDRRGPAAVDWECESSVKGPETLRWSDRGRWNAR